MSKLTEKQQTFDSFAQLEYVLVHLDARKDGVDVPDHLCADPNLCLKLSYHFQGETTYDDTAVTSYLKFSGDYYKCVIPWDTIWAMTSSSQEQRMWPEDIPKELVLQLMKKQLGSFVKKVFKKQDEQIETTQDTCSKPADSGPKKKCSHLKRIK